MTRRLFGPAGLVALGAALAALLGSVLAPSRPGEPSAPGPSESNGQKQRGVTDQGRSTAERVSLAVALLLIAGLVGGISYLELSRGSRPTTVEVTALTEQVRGSGGLYYLPIEVTNRGDAAAEAIRVLVELDLGGGADAAGLEVDRLGGQASRRGTVVFRRDPRGAVVQARVLSFLEP